MPTYNHKVGNLGGSFDLDVDADLDNMHLSIEQIPEFVCILKELPRIVFDDINTNFRVKELPRIVFDDINTNFRVKELPRIDIDAKTNSTLDISIKEIPDVRAHLPSHYNLGISFLGLEVINFSLCGESQLIIEKYRPRHKELCR